MHAAHQSGAAVAEAGVAFGRYQTCHNQFVVQFHPDETRSAQNQQPTEGPIPNHRLGSLFLGSCFLFCFVLDGRMSMSKRKTVAIERRNRRVRVIRHRQRRHRPCVSCGGPLLALDRFVAPARLSFHRFSFLFYNIFFQNIFFSIVLSQSPLSSDDF